VSQTLQAQPRALFPLSPDSQDQEIEGDERRGSGARRVSDDEYYAAHSSTSSFGGGGGATPASGNGNNSTALSPATTPAEVDELWAVVSECTHPICL
jgi:hypothetical protein